MTPHPLTLPQGMRYDGRVSKEMVLENTVVNRSNRPDSAVLSCPNSVPSFGQDGESGNASRTTLTGVFNILPTLRLKTPGDLKVSSTEQAMTAQVATISATPDLEIIEGQITTTSQQIAAHFGKRHADVIRAIRKLESPEDFNERNFALVEFTDAKGEKRPAYRITRDGFTLLAMGFTGKEAMQWKLAYLAAFNKMEQELLARNMSQTASAIGCDYITTAQKQDLKELVNAIVATGKQTYGETWARLQSKFRVNKYEFLPASKFDDAREYLLGKLPETPAPALPDAQRLQLAFSVAAEAGAQVQRSVFEQLTNGAAPDMVHARTIAAVSFDRNGKPTIPWAQAMGAQEFITTADDLPRMLACRDVSLTDVQASHIIGACAQILSESATRRLA